MSRKFLPWFTAAVLLVSGCGSKTESASVKPTSTTATTAIAASTNIYANDTPNNFAPATQGALSRIYVPNSDGSTVSVIDPATNEVVDTIKVGRNPQHIVPAWDLKTLYVTNDLSNSLTPIDPKTAKRSGDDIPVEDPYNMYFTPDGASAIVVAEARQNLDFRDPHSFAMQHQTHVACKGVDHIDFSADGKDFVATCEFSGQLIHVDLADHKVTGTIQLPNGAMPQDIKLNPAGTTYYVADMVNNGLWTIDAKTFTNTGFIPSGPETHGLYVSRDAKSLYISNRGGSAGNGSVSVLDFASNKIVSNWPIAAPSTPDMGNVSADGKVLWLAGRRSSEVYGLSTDDGHLVARVKVGAGPHGLSVWPQPGTYSLGHTGIMR